MAHHRNTVKWESEMLAILATRIADQAGAVCIDANGARSHWSQFAFVQGEREARDIEQAPQSWLEPISVMAPYKIGQPTLYNSAFCDMVIEDMSCGYSLTAFGARICATASMLHGWAVKHEDFANAVACGRTARLRFFEEKHLGVVSTGGVGSQGQAAWRGLLNADPNEWADKREVSATIKVSLAGLVEQSLRPMLDITPAAQD